MAVAEQSKTFTTSFGDQIEIIPGYQKLFWPQIRSFKQLAEGLKREDIDLVLSGAGEEIKPDANELQCSFRCYAIRWFRVYMMLDMFAQAGLRQPFETNLDIGTGQAVQPRILRAMGKVKHAVGLDLYDRASEFSESSMKKAHRKLKWWKHIDRLQSHVEKGGLSFLSPELRNAFLHKFENPRILGGRYSGQYPAEDYYSLKVKHPYRLDEMLVQDFYDLDRQFDLITSYTSLEHFELERAIPKIAECLKPGGVAYLWIPYWWCPFNTTYLVGDFPWTAQRLTRDDFVRYCREHHPEDADDITYVYDYFDPQHPTLNTYIELAEASGLSLLGSRRFFLPGVMNSQQILTTLGHTHFSNVNLQEVLSQIHRFRPDVQLEDLYTQSIGILLQKTPRKEKMNADSLEKLRQKHLEVNYRPSNPLLKALREKVLQFYIR